MAYKDVTNKSMFSNPVFVADLFNTIYFKGESFINPSKIINGPTDFCLYKNNGQSVCKREADVCKLYYDKNSIIVLCIENQSVYDGDMYNRCAEYNKLIKEDLRRQFLITNDECIVFLNIIITYSSSRQKYICTKETKNDINTAINNKKDMICIREYRPKNEFIRFKSDINIFFNCIRLSRKGKEEELNNYVKHNLNTINKHPDIAYYLRELFNRDDIVVNPSKIKGRNKTFMSFWKVLQEEAMADGKKQGALLERNKIILNLYSLNISVSQIALATGMNEEEILNIVNEQKPD